MSQENVEIVRARFEAWNAGDMDAFVSCIDPEVDRADRRVGRSRGLSLVGRRSCASWAQQSARPGTPTALEPISDFIDAGDRVAREAASGVAQGRGPEADLEMTGVYTVRKGRIFGIEFFWDHAEALEAVGLSEQDAHADS